MPVDYVTLRLEGCNSEDVLKNPMLDFSLNYNEDGVVIDNKRVAMCHFCKIIVYDNGSVYFKGSLHKMYNSLIKVNAPNYCKDKNYNGFNGNDFTVENISIVIDYLEQLFGLNRCFFNIMKIEIGLNILLDFCPSFIVGNLLEQGSKSFEFKYNRNFAVCEKSDYYLKVYNKSLQYGLCRSVLRVELKSRKTRVFKSANINTLADLTHCNLKQAIKVLLKCWEGVLLYDCTIDETRLTVRQKSSLKNKYQYPKYWNNLKANNKDKPRKSYKKIVENYSQNLKNKISNKIKNTKISHFN